MEMLEKSSIIMESSRVNSRHITFGKAVVLTIEAVAITGSISFGSANTFKNGDKLISMQSTRNDNEDGKPDSRSMEIHPKEIGAINMSSEKTAAEQKTDDLEKYVDRLSKSIDSSRKELLQAIKDGDSSIEDKINALPTKEWVEKNSGNLEIKGLEKSIDGLKEARDRHDRWNVVIVTVGAPIVYSLLKIAFRF
jgi:hypothetical protein